MHELHNLKKRLQYYGGNQEGRMQQDKLRSLKKALLYSYQAATVKLQDGRYFRCLINPDKNKLDYEDKIISIPFKDICIARTDEDGNKVEMKPNGKTSEGEEEIGMKPGDIFEWAETNTFWLVYLQRLEEDAYFRAEIRQCEHEVNVNGKKYKAYLKGPDQTSILWHTRRGFGSWNDLNYDAVMYISKNEETLDFFHRFTIVEVDGRPWEVQIVDDLTTEGILTICLKEWFKNTIKDEAEAAEEKKEPVQEETDPTLPHIEGDSIVYPYDKKTYYIKNANGGIWKVGNKKAVIIEETENSVTIDIVTTKSGFTDLIYKRENEEDIILKIIIKSL